MGVHVCFAFIDSRVNLSSIDNSTAGAVSTGQDDISLGDINKNFAVTGD